MANKAFQSKSQTKSQRKPVFSTERKGSKFSSSRPQSKSRSRFQDDSVFLPKKKGSKWSEAAYKITGEITTPKKQALLSRKPVSITPAGEVKLERLQKVLARAGIASRRKAELLILEGAVTVNGKLATELGIKVDAEKDKIKVDGKMIITEVEPIYLALYKPKGMISSLADNEGRPHLGELTRQIREKVFPIGQMDFNSEGLILLTNDGNLADKIFKKKNLPKVFMVKIKGHPTERDIEFLEKGFYSPEGMIRFSSYGLEGNLRNKCWLRLEVLEGANLDLKEMLNRKGLLVDRIIRTAIGDISIKGMEPGEFRFLKRQDFETLVLQKQA